MINIYVGNLPYATSADDLASLFAPFGEVTKTAIVFDRDTGRSRGFGFVEMEDHAAGTKAIESLAGTGFNGRPLTINEARPRGSGKGNGNYASTNAVAPGQPAVQDGGYRRYERKDGPVTVPEGADQDAPSGYSSGDAGGYQSRQPVED